MKKGDKLHVLWEDAYSHDDWIPTGREAPFPACMTESMGFLFHRDSQRIVLAATRNHIEEPQSCMLIVIPKGMVRKVTVLS